MSSDSAISSFDTTALCGLRGFAALYILLFHSLNYTKYAFDIYGQVNITFIFIEAVKGQKSMLPF